MQCVGVPRTPYLGERDVAPVGEGGDDQARGAAQVLVLVVELRVADVAVAVVELLVPPAHSAVLPTLTLPQLLH